MGSAAPDALEQPELDKMSLGIIVLLAEEDHVNRRRGAKELIE